MMYSSSMSQPNLEQLTTGLVGAELDIVRACFTRKGTLKTGKPFKTVDCVYGKNEALFKGNVNYVWRMLCFDFLPAHPHCCMPVSADWDMIAAFPRYAYGTLDYTTTKQAQDSLRKQMDLLIKRAESNLPVTQQAGAMRWARAFGVIN